MIDDLARLIRLQALDLQIRDLTRQRSELPLLLEPLQLQTSEAGSAVRDRRGEMEELRRQRRDLEGEVDLLRARLRKYKEQQMEVKTNREYTAMMHEIEGCSGEITSKEDKVLAIMEQIEAHETAIEAADRALASARAALEARQAEVRRQEADLDTQIAAAQGERDLQAGGISDEALSLYRRVAEVRRGVAVAEAREQSCQGCHVRLRPQVFNEIRRNDRIFTCESCNRILYFAG